MIRSYSTSIDGDHCLNFLDQEDDGLIIGSMSVEASGETAHIYNLYVVPERRNKGIATRLIKTAMQELREELGVTSFTCLIKNKNKNSQAFFMKLEFRRSLIHEDEDSFYYTLFV